MGNTKKVGSTGRFGSRYGVGIRKRILKVEKNQNQKHTCPSCGKNKVTRKAKGIFKCKCGHTFAGGAYLPETLSGKIIKKVVSQKKFATLTKELEEKTPPAEEKTKKHEKKEDGEK
jgi:large subunit ribosomal protein L37Ae